MIDKDQRLIYEHMYGRDEEPKQLLNEPEEEDVGPTPGPFSLGRDEFRTPEELNDHVKRELLHIGKDQEVAHAVHELVRHYAHELRELADEFDIGVEEGGSATAAWIMINDTQEMLIDLVEDLGVEAGNRPPADYGTDEYPQGDAAGDPKYDKVIEAIKLFMNKIDQLRPPEGDS